YPDAFDRPPVIGLSKDYEIWKGGLARLIELYLMPIHSTQGVDVHLLGWGRELWELDDIGLVYPWIRSTDSAKPYVYAFHDIALNPFQAPPEYPGRPEHFFDLCLTETQLSIAGANVEIFQTAAHGNLYSCRPG